MNQVSTITQSELSNMNAVMGSRKKGSSSSGVDYPKLSKIAMDQTTMIGKGRDAEKNPFFGCFFLKTEDPEEYVYGETMRIRVLNMVYQYVHTDFSRPEGSQFINKTIQFEDFRQEPRDELGGIRCGKPTTKEMDGWPQEDKDKYKDIKCTRIIRCLASYKGKKKNGEEVEVKNHPAIIFHKGNHFQDFEKQVNRVLPANADWWDYEIELVPNFGVGQSGNQYANFTFKPIMKRLETTKEVYDSVLLVEEMIQSANEKVEAAYAAAIRAREVNHAALDAMDDSLAEDFDGGSTN